MKAMSKQQLAEIAGVTTKTLMSWCEPCQKELEAMGMQPHMKVLPPHIVRFITEKFCIDVEDVSVSTGNKGKNVEQTEGNGK